MSVRIIDSINKNMPSLINKTGEEYEAIFGKEDYIPNITINKSEDYNCGAVCNELEFVQGFIEYQIQQNNPDTIESDYLDSVVEFFTTLKRIYDETDEGLRNRFSALIRRNNNKRWMTKWSIKDVFVYFFDESNLYVIENPIEDTENLILNGDFENSTGSDFDNWIKSETGLSTVSITTTDMLVNDQAVDVYVNPGDGVNLKQTISSLTAGWYKIEFFSKDDGNCSLANPTGFAIQRSGDNYYWDFSSRSWVSSWVALDSISSLSYLEREGYFQLSDTRDITISMFGRSGTTSAYHVYYDQVKLGAIKTYPSIKVMAISVGTSSYSMAFWDNGGDPVSGTDYQYASFLDNEYIEGAGGLYTDQLYKDLLEKIKVAGTKSIFSIKSRSSQY